MNLFFSVKGQDLTKMKREKIAGFARNHIHAVFDFDRVWIDLLKYAIFSEPDGTKHVSYLGYGKILQCNVPQDVLKNTFFRVSVFAEDLLTSNEEIIIVSPSGYVAEIDDLEEGEVVKSSQDNTYFYHRDDEFFNERRNRFERVEHPYV